MRVARACFALIGMHAAHAQVVLPEIDVTASRIVSTGPGSGGGSAGGGTTALSTGPTSSIGIVARPRRSSPPSRSQSSPAQNLPDILAQQAACRCRALFSNTMASRTTVDLRGLARSQYRTCSSWSTAAAIRTSNFQGFDFSANSARQHRAHRDHARQQWGRCSMATARSEASSTSSPKKPWVLEFAGKVRGSPAPSAIAKAGPPPPRHRDPGRSRCSAMRSIRMATASTARCASAASMRR